jgi:peptidoglycan hydrolase-like protein with peptidoglycan-binding domain
MARQLFIVVLPFTARPPSMAAVGLPAAAPGAAGPAAITAECRRHIDMEMTMKKSIGKLVGGAALALALGIGSAALDYAAAASATVTAEGIPAVFQPSESRRDGDFFRKDDVRWAQVELRYRGLYNGSLDGVLGPGTRRALAQYQENSGLHKTASLDARTWEALTGKPEIGEGSSVPSNSDDTASHLGK